jgi:hypothetical protein
MLWNTFHFTLSPSQGIQTGYGWNDDHGSVEFLPQGGLDEFIA